MKTDFIHYYFLISCPSDVENDINIVFEIIDEVNRSVGEENLIYIIPLYWKKDAIPAAGKSAQTIINVQLLDEADGVIALFWTKFGTPTDKYGSGTEEEIAKAIEKNKDVILLCSNRKVSMKEVNYEQYSKVEDFKTTYKGLFASYCTDNDLKEQLRIILTKIIYKYARKSKSSEKEIVFDKNIKEYSLAEYYELGWFLGRSVLELPADISSPLQNKYLFNNRMSMLLTLVLFYKILNNENYQLIASYSETIQKKGLNEYLQEYGSKKFEEVQCILKICQFEIAKKLVKGQAAVFRMGIGYGHYLTMVQVGWLQKGNLSTLEDIINIEREELDNVTKCIYSYSDYIDAKFHEKIKERWQECHENVNIDLNAYNDKMNALSEEIIHFLQLYS